MSTEMKKDEMELAIRMLEKMNLSLDRFIEKHLGWDEEERRRRLQELRDRGD
ncbi:MAG: hypothetical protein U9P07_00975 [Pseudomonadota bacterium]|nr:hypothetical protein [Pseudomonadota bacterium]